MKVSIIIRGKKNKPLLKVKGRIGSFPFPFTIEKLTKHYLDNLKNKMKKIKFFFLQFNNDCLSFSTAVHISKEMKPLDFSISL